MKKSWLKGTIVFLVATVVFAGIAGCIYYFYFIKAKENIPVKTGSAVDIAGTVNFVDTNSGMINIGTVSGDKNLSVGDGTQLFDDNNNPVDINFYRSGFKIEAQGMAGDGNSLNVSIIKAVSIPNIIILFPSQDESVDNSFVVQGKARVFENQFNIRVISGGRAIFEANSMTNASDAGQFGDFEQTVSFDPSAVSSPDLSLEVFDYSAKDGSEIDKVSVPLKYQPGDVTSVKIFFNNSKMEPDFSCDKVFPVSRNVKKTLGIGKAALGELLKGPTDQEKADGYFTNINPGTRVQSLAIDQNGGVAAVDFNGNLEAAGGSCRVTAIRAQITQTLKQFPGVKDVVISVNGNSTSTLQP